MEMDFWPVFLSCTILESLISAGLRSGSTPSAQRLTVPLWWYWQSAIWWSRQLRTGQDLSSGVLAACFPLVSENILQTRDCFLPCPYSSSPSPCLHRASTCLLNSAPRYPCLSLQLRHPHPEQGPHHLFRPQAATTPLKAMPASASHWQVWGTREMTDFHSRRVTGWENTSPRKQAQ